ncbi:MAG: hypothetical protein ACLPY5_00010 [Candidatus Bathyarchaeia archaeon]
MKKKLIATIAIAVFVFSSLAAVSPAYSHYTLGNSSPNSPFHVNNFDPHVNGLLGYVWPGAGENSYAGFPTVTSSDLSPGYEPPNIQGSAYSPYGAILAGSTGDLIFGLTSSDFTSNLGWTTLAILIPPEFGGVVSEQVVSTLTDNYANIVTKTLSPYDRYAPGWTIVYVTADSNTPNQFINFTTRSEWYYVRINSVLAPLIAGTYFFKMYLYSTSPGSGELNSTWVPTQNWPVLLVKGEVDPAVITGTIRYGTYNPTLNGGAIQEAGKVVAHMRIKLDPYTGAQLISCPSIAPSLPGCTDAVGYFNATAQGHYEVEGVATGIYDLYAEAAGYPQQLIASDVTVLKGQSLHFDGYLDPGVVINGAVYTKHEFGEEPWPDSSYIKIELYDAPTVNHVPDPAANLVSWSPLPCIAGGQESYAGGSHAGSCGDPRSGSAIAFPWYDYTPSNGFSSSQVSDSVSTDQTQDPQGVGPPQHWFVQGGTNNPFNFQFGMSGLYGAPRDLDGQVPQIYATWVNGLTPGTYYVRAWVFRYVQSAVDGATFQEFSFSVTPDEWAGDVSVPIDLRLSSWVNTTVYFHNIAGTISTSTINTGAGYVYGALLDATGNVVSFNVTSVGLTNSSGMYRHNGYDTILTKQATTSDPNDPSGVNSNAIQTGVASIEFWGINDTWNGENYGIPAGTFAPNLWAAGYLQNEVDPVSVTLSGTAVSISEHLNRGAGFLWTVTSNDWEQPSVARNWVWNGQEIDIGIYQNSTYVDNFGEEPSFMANVAPFGSNLFQNSAVTSLSVNGGGQNILPGDGAQSAFFGEEGEYQNTGGYTSYALTIFNEKFRPSFGYLPTAFASGIYEFRAWTYGYIQSESSVVSAEQGQVADISIQLIIGINVNIQIGFTKENIITPTDTILSVRLRLFDESGRLVGEWMSSEGVYSAGIGVAQAADGTNGFDFGAGNGNESSTQTTNHLPSGTTQLNVLMAGLPQVPPRGRLTPDNTLLYYGDPVFTGGANSERKIGGNDFEVDELAFPYFLNTGIAGAPYYAGGWSAELDTVNWYASTSSNTPNYFPPVAGILLGESYHIIPGTTAVSGVSFTEDGALSGLFVGHTMSINHFGPDSQQGVWLLNGGQSSGEVSGIFQVNLNGLLSGTVLGFTWTSEFRPLSWSPVSVSSIGNLGWTYYTYDGIYEMFLPPGNYAISVTSPGFLPDYFNASITSGTTSSVREVDLNQSNIPVPEFSGISVIFFTVSGLSTFLISRRRRNRSR